MASHGKILRRERSPVKVASLLVVVLLAFGPARSRRGDRRGVDRRRGRRDRRRDPLPDRRSLGRRVAPFESKRVPDIVGVIKGLADRRADLHHFVHGHPSRVTLA
jgi:hypothetical protein